ncbi:uncharacterized protein LOC119167881 [Rhipicephalus microplus]|uniref:uncharacterized protein LOC119167881 n=1 Tax=Rhipicephalus microplus TaxID=6941 RepID=UPI003F6C7940
MRLVLANGLFWGNALVATLAVGIALLGASFGVRWKRHILALMPGHHLSLVSVFLVGSGCVLLVVSLFGLFISWRLRKRDRLKEGGLSAERGARGCAVYNAMAAVVIVNVALSSAIVYRYVMRARLDVDEDLKYAMYQYFVDASSRDKLDSLHREFKCCGVRNYTDWTMATRAVADHAAGGRKTSASRSFVPRTCCVVESSEGACLKYHEQGCRDVLVDYFNMLMPSVIFCAVCVTIWLATLILTSYRLRRILLENPHL